MPDLVIRAMFPLGVYQGHRTDGKTDPFPDTARLHAALLHSAGRGTFAEVGEDGRLHPAPSSLRALRWLERHAPTALAVPQMCRVSLGRSAESWRDQGTLTKDYAGYKKLRPTGTGVAVNGDFGWMWQDVPPEVCSVIEGLCDDVSCLGEADSPVQLKVAPFEPTHTLGEGAELRPQGKLVVRSPHAGRTDALEEAHLDANPVKRPSPSEDRFRADRGPSPHPVPMSGTTNEFYDPVAARRSEVPWEQALLLPASAPVPLEERVAWCVALHRTLAARVGDDAPPVLTGRYSAGVPQPANRVAIQYLAAIPDRPNMRDGGFAVMLPGRLSPADLAAVHQAVSGARKLYRRGQVIELDRAVSLPDLQHFWPEALPGWNRSWVPNTALMPETRRQSGKRPRSLCDAALLSMAFTFRDELVAPGENLDYATLIARVEARGASAMSARLIPDSRTEHHVHKLPRGLVAQPYTAELDMGSLISPTALVAIGQTRHLGGGLLVPVDSPVERVRS